ncbi:MAG: hypothetical protein FJ206_05375 [Gemmatimonadetes bacterium]|nr:hypothetical protein [Gemmatimonadota bacterium]
MTWPPAANVVKYSVSRGKGGDPSCCNATSGDLPATASSWQDAGLYRPGSYQFTLTAHYADGSVGAAAVNLDVRYAAAPTPITVNDVAAGKIQLKWNAATPGTSGILIQGPGVVPGYGAVGTTLVLGGGPLDLFLPAGNHSWKVAAVYDANNVPVLPATTYGSYPKYGTNYVVLAPPSEWADVSHEVKIRGDRFRISLERFEAVTLAGEDILRSDGRGNEVYIATQVNEYRRWGRPAGSGPVSQRMLKTPTFGDAHNFPGRIQAGTASPTGGINTNDSYPAPVHLISQLAAPTTGNLPFFLWEGELTEIDGAVIISPSIWESDEDNRLFQPFADFHAYTAGNLQYLNALYPFMPWYPSGAQNLWRPIRCPATASGQYPSYFTSPLGAWGDEPVDMQERQSYCQTYVAINWRIASSYTSVNPAAVVEIPMVGTPPWGSYKLFVRIEKLAPPPAMVAPTRMRRSVP